MWEMARPRKPEKALSKWGVWKRQQRDKPANGLCPKCKKRSATVKHHVDGSKPRPAGQTVSWCRECHTAYHNALRKKGQ